MEEVGDLFCPYRNRSQKTNSTKSQQQGKKKGNSNKYKKSKGKKHHKTNKQKLKNTLQLQGIPQIPGMDSNNWMQSYAIATEWQQKQQVAYWKSKAVSLEYENKILHTIIRNMHLEAKAATGMIVHSEQPTALDVNSTQAHFIEVNSVEEDENDSEEESENYEMVVSEEWINFLEQNSKHKLALQKEKDERNKLPDCYTEDIMKMEQPPSASENDEKDKVLKLLYGESVLRVVGLETCMQLNFDRKKMLRKPVFWPNIPLKL